MAGGASRWTVICPAGIRDQREVGACAAHGDTPERHGVPVGGELRREGEVASAALHVEAEQPPDIGVITIASDHTWWCDERPNAVLKSPESSSVT